MVEQVLFFIMHYVLLLYIIYIWSDCKSHQKRRKQNIHRKKKKKLNMIKKKKTKHSPKKEEKAEYDLLNCHYYCNGKNI